MHHPRGPPKLSVPLYSGPIVASESPSRVAPYRTHCNNPSRKWLECERLNISRKGQKWCTIQFCMKAFLATAANRSLSRSHASRRNPKLCIWSVGVVPPQPELKRITLWIPRFCIPTATFTDISRFHWMYILFQSSQWNKKNTHPFQDQKLAETQYIRHWWKRVAEIELFECNNLLDYLLTHRWNFCVSFCSSLIWGYHISPCSAWAFWLKVKC